MKRSALAVVVVAATLAVSTAATGIFVQTRAGAAQAPTPTDTVAPVSAGAIARLDESEQQWNRHPIASYRLTVIDGGAWRSTSYTITVKQGHVVEAWAIEEFPGPRKYEMDNMAAEDYIPPGLFTKARSLLRGRDAPHARVTYDKDFYFPRTLSVDDPNVFDDEWRLQVTNFTVIR